MVLVRPREIAIGAELLSIRVAFLFINVMNGQKDPSPSKVPVAEVQKKWTYLWEQSISIVINP
ncbi:hypothetical protein [Niabella beijingensis]|uniref:hypothetical protein n=1 Tax=Niabella beijingensis TaxID=2872700 RepID=UPI001CBB5EFA|nr:hypothetical protein [Niabella beijingensis]MBZ4187802.1 hypothetical protein [Niabella beijingensis]